MRATEALATTGLPRFAAPADGTLTPAMCAAYAAAGVIVLEDFVTAAACRRLIDRVQELVTAMAPDAPHSVFSTTREAHLADEYFLGSGDRIRCFFEADAFDATGRLRQPLPESINKIGHALHDLDPVFDAFSRTPKLAAAAASLGLSSGVIIQSMYIFKPPRIGGEVVWHQDSTYLYTEPESCTGFWFALEDATLQNGCMHFLPGAHRGPLKARHGRQPDGSYATTTLDTTPWPAADSVAAEAPAGSLVIFDGRAPHLSGPNRSAVSRHAYTLHTVDPRSHYPAENWLQRDPGLPLRGFA